MRTFIRTKQKMFLRGASNGLLWLTFFFILSACQSVPVPDWQKLTKFWPGSTNAPEPQLEIKLMGWKSDDATSQRLMMLINLFNEQRTDIHVSLQLVPSYDDTLNRAFLDKNVPDLFLVDSFQLPTLVQSQQIQPLSTYAKQSGQSLQTDAFYTPLIDAFTLDQSAYCLPSEFNTLALLYNKTLFDEAEIAYPTDSWEWIDLRTAALAITKLPTTFFDISGMAITPDFSRWLPFLYQSGGTVTDDNNAAMTLNTPAALEAMSFYLNLVADGAAIEPKDISSSWSGEAFGKGRVGMIIEGNWVIPYLAQEFPDLDYGVAPLPAGPAGRATVAFSWCYAVSSSTPHPEAAFDLALYLTSQNALQLLGSGRPSIPARLALQADWLNQHPGLEPFVNGIAYARPWRFGTHFQDVVVAINTSMQQALDAEVSAEEVLRVAETIGTEVLSR